MDVETLQRLQTDVESGGFSRVKLAGMYGCSESYIRKLIKKHEWTDPRKNGGAACDTPRTPAMQGDLIDIAAIRKFEEIKAELGDQITKADETLLTTLANQYARYIRLEREVLEEGEVIISQKGAPYLNPRFNALQSAAKTLTTLGKEFGLSIASRKRAGVIAGHIKKEEGSIFDMTAQLEDYEIEI